MTCAYIGVGANISPEANIEAALTLLAVAVRPIALSTFYRTQAEGRPEQPDYLNGVVAIETDLPPRVLKDRVLGDIELTLGRQRSEDKYAARRIDLDLLLYGSLLMDTPELRLPAADIEQRAFVAVPLAEIAPDLKVPGTGLRVRDIAARFADVRMRPHLPFTNALRHQWLSLGGNDEH